MSRSLRLILLACFLSAPLGCNMCSDCADYGPTAVREHHGYRPTYDEADETTVTVEAESETFGEDQPFELPPGGAGSLTR